MVPIFNYTVLSKAAPQEKINKMKTFLNNDSLSKNRTVAFLQYCSLQLVDIPVQNLKRTQLHKA